MPLRALVIGGTGLVGNALLRAWKSRGADVSASTFRFSANKNFFSLDIRSENAVRDAIDARKPDVVALPAANPHVDGCELDPAGTRAVNVAGTINVAKACREAGSRLIFFSSDYVFDGRKGAYDETDAPCPINEYGRQKVAAEKAILDLNSKNLIVRTSGAYGWQRNPQNLVLQIRERLSRGETMPVASDVRYNPTYVEDLADITLMLAEKSASGIFHAAGADEVARADFAKIVARAFELDPSLLKPVPLASLHSPTPRPLRSSLLAARLRREFNRAPLGVNEGLRRMIAMRDAWRAYLRELPIPPQPNAIPSA